MLRVVGAADCVSRAALAEHVASEPGHSSSSSHEARHGTERAARARFKAAAAATTTHYPRVRLVGGLLVGCVRSLVFQQSTQHSIPTHDTQHITAESVVVRRAAGRALFSLRCVSFVCAQLARVPLRSFVRYLTPCFCVSVCAIADNYSPQLIFGGETPHLHCRPTIATPSGWRVDSVCVRGRKHTNNNSSSSDNWMYIHFSSVLVCYSVVLANFKRI